MFYELMEKTYKMEKEGARIIRLNVGDTKLPSPIYAIEAIENFLHYRKAEYVSSGGVEELREKIAQRENCSIDNVIVGSGSKILIYGLLKILAKPGNRIVFPSPYWPAYMGMCKDLSLQADVIKTDIDNSWNFDNLYPRGAKVMIICNPLNPTSTVYPEELIKKTIKEAKEMGVTVILDEAYRGIAFKEIPKYEGAIRVRSFSKEFNMEGWRLAYTIAPEEIVKKLISLYQIVTTCTPPFIQWAGLECLNHEKELLGRNIRIWKQRAQFATKLFKEAGFKFAEPESGMYLFMTHKKIKDSLEFTYKALEAGVAVSPGITFGDYPEYFRICLNQPEDIMKEALDKMINCINGKES